MGRVFFHLERSKNLSLIQAQLVIPLGSNGRRIVLQKEELLLLKELCIHRTMQSKDVHDFYQCASEKPRHSDSISRRLKRLVDVGILLRMKEDVSTTRAIISKYYYKIARRGLWALVQVGVLTEEEANQLHLQILSLRIPKVHNIAASSLANRVRVKGIQTGMTGFNHFRGVDDERLLNNLKTIDVEREIVIADWVFQEDERTIYLEVDSGSQQNRVIESKVARYIKFARTIEDEVVIVFSIMDESVNKAKSSDRSRRVASLKECMPACQHWPDNLSIYVITAKRTPDLILRLLEEYEPLSAEYRGYVIDEWLGDWKQTEKGRYHFKIQDQSDVYGANRVKELEADKIVRLDKQNEGKLVALLYAEEGSVKSYQRIRANHYRTVEIGNGQKLHDVIMVYRNLETMNHDVQGVFWDKAWFTHRHSFKEDQSLKFPSMLKPVSHFRKESIKFE